MIKIKVLITFCWVANALVYTTIAYNTENIGDNLLVTWTLTAAVEAPATISNLFVLNRYGRILPMVSGMIIAGNTCRWIVFKCLRLIGQREWWSETFYY